MQLVVVLVQIWVLDLGQSLLKTKKNMRWVEPSVHIDEDFGKGSWLPSVDGTIVKLHGYQGTNYTMLLLSQLMVRSPVESIDTVCLTLCSVLNIVKLPLGFKNSHVATIVGFFKTPHTLLVQGSFRAADLLIYYSTLHNIV